ncbi:MAG: CrcB family protein, partial [Campylobacteraceae bacterium]|nr:CrcB family protein [Campylobacteraceae bacterium]
NVSLPVKLFFVTGFLGSFTTFSAFALDTGFLVSKGEFLKTFLYISLSVFLGLMSYFAAVWLLRGIMR